MRRSAPLKPDHAKGVRGTVECVLCKSHANRSSITQCKEKGAYANPLRN